MLKPIALSTLLASFLLPMAHAQDSNQGFIQDRFAIGYWVTPPLDENIEQRFQEIEDAYFSLILAGYTPKSSKVELELCRKHDLKALFWGHNGDPKDLLTAPEIWGYIIKDEPRLSQFSSVKKRVDEIKAMHPNKLCYVNLYPNYADPKKQLETETYDEYVAAFIDQVQPEVLSMDHYPQFHANGDTRSSYTKNLEQMREHSLKAGIPFWNFFNTIPYGPHTDPTESQLRWQIYRSLTCGAKGVLYFCYYTPNDSEFSKGGAIIDRNGNKTRHYAQAQRINKELKNLGPTLMQLTSTDVLQVEGQKSDRKLTRSTPIRKLINENPASTPLALYVGAFKHTDGRKAVMIHNDYFAYTSWMTIQFSKPLSKITEIDKQTGKEIAVYDESPNIPGTQISLDSSEGRLFLVNP